LINIKEFMIESFDLIKKTQIKRNTKTAKIADLNEKIEELEAEGDPENDEELKKITEQV